MTSVKHPYQGVRSKVLLDYSVSTDIWNGAGLTAATWTDIFAAQNFTVEHPDSLILIFMNGFMLGTNGTPSAECASCVYVDSTTRYLWGDGWGIYYNYLAGGGGVAIEGLAPGVHTVRPQVIWGGSGSTANYLRAATQIPEKLRLTVVEIKPRLIRPNHILKPRIALSYVDATNANVTSGAFPLNIMADQAFTLVGANSTVLILTRAGILISVTTGNRFGMSYYIDSSLEYLAASDMTDTNTGNFCGAGPLWLPPGTLAAGAHNIRARIRGSTTINYLIRTGLIPYEHYEFQVIEIPG